MAYQISRKEIAIGLRKQGFSLQEISEKLNISKSTGSLWLNQVILSKYAKQRLEKRKQFGQDKLRKILAERRQNLAKELNTKAVSLINNMPHLKDLYKIYSALLFWCEGNKATNKVRFTNSDPLLIKMFITMLRKGFNIKTTKFRALMHLHQYHNETKQKEYWHKITKIPLRQFNRTYWKPNTGKNIHENYPGCIAITYYDSKVAKELFSTYNALAHRGVGQW